MSWLKKNLKKYCGQLETFVQKTVEDMLHLPMFFSLGLAKEGGAKPVPIIKAKAMPDQNLAQSWNRSTVLQFLFWPTYMFDVSYLVNFLG